MGSAMRHTTTLLVEPRRYGYRCTCGSNETSLPSLADAIDAHAGHREWHEWVDNIEPWRAVGEVGASSREPGRGEATVRQSTALGRATSPSRRIP